MLDELPSNLEGVIKFSYVNILKIAVYKNFYISNDNWYCEHTLPTIWFNVLNKSKYIQIKKYMGNCVALLCVDG